MAGRIKLSADNIDEISQILRFGLGLFLLGLGWNLIEAYQPGAFSADALWSALHLSGALPGWLTALLFEGALASIFTPDLVMRFAFGLSLAAAIFLFLGFWVRFYSTLFALFYVVPWLIALVEAVPWLFDGGDYITLRGSTMTAWHISIAFLFLVLIRLGPGSHSLDSKFRMPWTGTKSFSWDSVAIMIRMALAILFLTSFASQMVFSDVVYHAQVWLTGIVGVMIFFGLAPRVSGALALLTIGWHLWVLLIQVGSFGAAMDAFLPQTPMIAAAVIFMLAGGGVWLKPNVSLTRKTWGRIH